MSNTNRFPVTARLFVALLILLPCGVACIGGCDSPSSPPAQTTAAPAAPSVPPPPPLPET